MRKGRITNAAGDDFSPHRSPLHLEEPVYRGKSKLEPLLEPYATFLWNRSRDARDKFLEISVVGVRGFALSLQCPSGFAFASPVAASGSSTRRRPFPAQERTFALPFLRPFLHFRCGSASGDPRAVARR